MNNQLLHEWIHVLASNADTMIKFYEAWAFVRSSTDGLVQLMGMVQSLRTYKFTLSLDHEINRWDLH